MSRYQDIFIKSLIEVLFVERYKTIIDEYNELNFNKLVMNIDRKEIVDTIKSFGYSVKKFPGGGYDIREEFRDFTFQLYVNVKGGMMTNYLGVFFKGEMINDVNRQYNFAFIYRHLMNNPNAEITAPKFTSYTEFKLIAKEILNIYEDFKIAFTEQVNRLT